MPHIPLPAILGISWGCPVCYCGASPLWEQLGPCGCPLTALLKAVEAELGTERDAGVLGLLGWAQALVGGTGLAQRPVALGQLGQHLGIQQELAAGGHGRWHSWCCKDSRAMGIPMPSLPTSAQATPTSALGWVGRGHGEAAVMACFGRAS